MMQETRTSPETRQIMTVSQKVEVMDLARDDMAEAVENAFRYGKLVLATTSYNAGIFPYMRDFILHLTDRGFQKRTVAFIENGSWSPMAMKVMRGLLENCKDIKFADHNVTIKSAMNNVNKAEIAVMAAELVQ